jgi:hypothetical protein
MRRPALVVTALLGAAFLAGACTSAGATGGPDASARPTSPVPTLPHGTVYVLASGSADLVLRIVSGGGLVPMGFQLTLRPSLALYGDGTFLVDGPVDAIYPSRLLPNVLAGHLTAAEIQRVVAAADGAGLLGPDATYDAGGIADAPTTVFTTTVDGRTHTVSAYALGLDTRTAGGSGATDAAARARLHDFSVAMTDVSTLVGRTIPMAAYAPAATRVFVSAPGDPGSAQPTGAELAWPISTDPAAGAATKIAGIRCLLLSGADGAAFLAAAANANQLTTWRAPSGVYRAMVRPLYPDETGCPA